MAREVKTASDEGGARVVTYTPRRLRATLCGTPAECCEHFVGNVPSSSSCQIKRLLALHAVRAFTPLGPPLATPYFF